MLRGLLIDLSGVIYAGDHLLPGARAGLRLLDEQGIPYRFVTNTTSRARRAIVDQLAALGLQIAMEQVITPAAATVDWLRRNGLSAHLLIHPALHEDFAEAPKVGPVAVVVGDAREGFSYESLNAAFRPLLDGAPLVALAMNRRFLGDDGQLWMDVGAFVRALEYAAEAEAIVMGKPAPDFLKAAARTMTLACGEVGMVGDDAEADVLGALDAGCAAAALVRSGKYRPGDEARPGMERAVVAGCFDVAVRRLLGLPA